MKGVSGEFVSSRSKTRRSATITRPWAHRERSLGCYWTRPRVHSFAGHGSPQILSPLSTSAQPSVVKWSARLYIAKTSVLLARNTITTFFQQQSATPSPADSLARIVGLAALAPLTDLAHPSRDYGCVALHVRSRRAGARRSPFRGSRLDASNRAVRATQPARAKGVRSESAKLSTLDIRDSTTNTTSESSIRRLDSLEERARHE